MTETEQIYLMCGILLFVAGFFLGMELKEEIMLSGRSVPPYICEIDYEEMERRMEFSYGKD